MVTRDPSAWLPLALSMNATPAGYYHPPTSTGYYHSPPTSSRHPYYSLPPVQASPPSHRAPPLPYSRTPLPPLRQSHHSPPYALHRTPPYGAAYAASGELPSFDEVRTLFVAGLPGDVKVREVYNLFREFPGFWTLTSEFKAYVFSVFTDQQSALAAMHSLNGLVFDIERELSIHMILRNQILGPNAQEQALMSVILHIGMTDNYLVPLTAATNNWLMIQSTII
ncbi:hypothetical protein ZIOFF_059153 [Zingiber officinale]|uniref:RRM domain-containing protein n=1 Tax=Zingiber officinale TaxID=94328 RepID=A0A8J5KJZ7_ZINOF|nr:hypothetical protein ZIOFF_059153 [Zingiber officinale]